MIRSMNNPHNIRLKGLVYHARMKIPEDVRGAFNGKWEFSQTLDTSRPSEARQRAPLVIALWMHKIQEARTMKGATEDHSPAAWAKRWLAELNVAPPALHAQLLDHSTNEIEQKVEAGLMTLPEAHKAQRISLGTDVYLKTYADAFLDEMYTGKSRSSMSGALNHFLNRFDTPESITPVALRAWWQSEAKGSSANTIDRVLSVSKGYMRYLRNHDLVKHKYTDLLKAEDLRTPKTAIKPQPYQPFTVAECLDLLERATLVKGSANLTLLMQVGMYTGARLEEVASIKRSDIHLGEDWMLIRGTKTRASENREVPIHADLKLILIAALASHSDRYLIKGLPEDQHGNRANAIGKQFGRLKAAAGFTSRSKCFHSYRKTFVTQMEQSGIPEGVVADIVGHEKSTITYGVYSGGSSMLQKMTAIKSLSFLRL